MRCVWRSSRGGMRGDRTGAASDPTQRRGRVLGALLVLVPVIVLVFLPDRPRPGPLRGHRPGHGGDCRRQHRPRARSRWPARCRPPTSRSVTSSPSAPPGEEPSAVGGSVTRRIVSIEDGGHRPRATTWRSPTRGGSTSPTSTYPRVVVRGAVGRLPVRRGGPARAAGVLLRRGRPWSRSSCALAAPRRRVAGRPAPDACSCRMVPAVRRASGPTIRPWPRES